jgi:hypothetical protein
MESGANWFKPFIRKMLSEERPRKAAAAFADGSLLRCLGKFEKQFGGLKRNSAQETACRNAKKRSTERGDRIGPVLDRSFDRMCRGDNTRREARAIPFRSCPGMRPNSCARYVAQSSGPYSNASKGRANLIFDHSADLRWRLDSLIRMLSGCPDFPSFGESALR